MARMTASCGTNDLNTDKGEVGGSSPPRPTIQITSKEAAILTFPLSGNTSQKTDLPTICQLSDWADRTTLRGLGASWVEAERLASIRLRRARCKAVQGTTRLWKEREVVLVSLRGVVQLVRRPGCLPPGTSAMKRLREKILYNYEETPTGARVVIKTADPSALDAIHDFLRYQIREHETGDPETIG